MSKKGVDVPNVLQTPIRTVSLNMVGNDYVILYGGWGCKMELITFSAMNNNIDTQSFRSIRSRETNAPVLTSLVDPNSRVAYYAGFDNQITAWDVASDQTMVIGSHSRGINSIRYSPQHSIIVSSGYDGMVKFWDVRQKNQQPVGQLQAPTSKIYDMDMNGNIIVTCGIDKQLTVTDIRQPQRFLQSNKAPLDFELSCIAAQIDGAGLAVASLDGRGWIQYFNTPANNFHFRSNRQPQTNNITDVSPFNGFATHPIKNTLITYSSNGKWTSWDHQNRSRLTEYCADQSIAAVSISPDGRFIVSATSPNWHGGAQRVRAKPNVMTICAFVPADLTKSGH